MRHYAGGLAGWTAAGGALESASAHATPRSATAGARPGRPAASGAGRAAFHLRLLDWLGNRTIGELFQIWFWMICGFGVLYWIVDAAGGDGLRASGAPVPGTAPGFLTAIYFSFVTALSIGYGDVIPTGILRVLAVVEGAAGLLLFGAVISKFVSRRQEELTGEIHHFGFESRLGRVRTNLHLVLSEMDAIAALCVTAGAPPERIRTRVESAAGVFEGELRAVHDLLYRPQLEPDEHALASILATLTAGLRQMADLRECMPPAARDSVLLAADLREISRLAEEICADCVPRSHPPALDAMMNEIQSLARRFR